MEVRFVLVPGWVFSHNDGDKHWVGVEELMRLHRVHPAECIIFNKMTDVFRGGDSLITLSPSPNGKYKDYSVED